MYTPPFNRIEDENRIREFVAGVQTAWLVTAGEDSVPAATLLPIIWRDDTVLAHMAVANPHWRAIRPHMPALLIVTGPDAYISPSWYAAKQEHGKVVPTWNYTAAHLTGTLQVHKDATWLRHAVTELTDRHEGGRAEPWHVTDAPSQYIDAQLGGIVGVEMTVTRVEGKAKLSQNRSAADQRGVIDGLRTEHHPSASEVAEQMQAALQGTTRPHD